MDCLSQIMAQATHPLLLDHTTHPDAAKGAALAVVASHEIGTPQGISKALST